MYSMAKQLIHLCESIRREDRKIINEDNISIKFNAKYDKDINNPLPYIIDLSNVDSDRLEYIQNTIQSNIDDNKWRISDRSVDGSTSNMRCESSNGSVMIHYPNNSIYPNSIEFFNQRESSEFFDEVTVDPLPSDEEEEEEESPQQTEPEENPENPMNPDQEAIRNENPDGSVNPGRSADGSDLGSLNIA